ncbi:hypothetical protein SUGI_0318540 [Cryptomeria japonica]|nr:hypothetical protein SUGI_0318540 [Cryptomeria japonica]
MIGCVAAQSIGEPATQMTLNTFHYAGVSAKNVQCALEDTTLQSVTKAAGIWYDPDQMNTIIEEDDGFLLVDKDDRDIVSEDLSQWVVLLEFSQEMMVDKNLCMEDIEQKINEDFGDDFKCIPTDTNAPKMILHLRVVNEETKVQSENQSSEDDTFLKKVETNLLNELQLCGILDIGKVFIREGKNMKFDRIQGFVEEKEWALDMEGVNLLAVMVHEDVDYTRTSSNHMVEVLEVLGIEVVRKSLMEEICNMISFDGSYVYYRHLAILCDTMTYWGHLMAITHHGINQNDTGPMMRCSFEETVDILLDATAYAQNDPLRGVTENIMLGQLARIDLWPNDNGSFLWNLRVPKSKEDGSKTVVISHYKEDLTKIKPDMPLIYLDPLSKKDSWRLFESYAFGSTGLPLRPEVMQNTKGN